MQDAAGSGSENVSNTGDQLVMAVLQSQTDGVKIKDESVKVEMLVWQH